jgi:formylglycine-generating enzyme required for sulfatase activity
VWAARCGQKDVLRPWELYPFYLNPEQMKENRDTAEIQRFTRAQDIMRKIFQDSAKHQTAVTYDEPNSFGVCGLIGNVREW